MNAKRSLSGAERTVGYNAWRRFETSLADSSDSVPKEVVIDALRALGDAIDDAVESTSAQKIDLLPWHADDLSSLCLGGIEKILGSYREESSRNRQDDYMNALAEEADRHPDYDADQV